MAATCPSGAAGLERQGQLFSGNLQLKAKLHHGLVYWIYALLNHMGSEELGTSLSYMPMFVLRGSPQAIKASRGFKRMNTFTLVTPVIWSPSVACRWATLHSVSTLLLNPQCGCDSHVDQLLSIAGLWHRIHYQWNTRGLGVLSASSLTTVY